MTRQFWRRNAGHIVGWVVVVVGVTTLGVADALPGRNTVTSDDIVNGQVRRPDIGFAAVDGSKVANGSLTGADIRNGSVGSADVKNGALTGDDVRDGSVAGDDIADQSLTGTDVADNSLTGRDIREQSLDFGCANGNIGNSYAEIKASEGIPDEWVSSKKKGAKWFGQHRNCSGKSIELLRDRRGVYLLRFNGDPSRVVLVTSKGTVDFETWAQARWAETPRYGKAFYIFLYDDRGAGMPQLVDSEFVVMTL